MAAVSDASQGPGWWQASDGRWYPPEASAPPPPPPPPPPPGAPAGYVAFDPSLAPPKTAGKATATLILGLVAFLVCPVLPAIAALVVGAQAKREIRESGGALTGDGLVKAGRILAVVHLCLFFVAVLAAIAIPTFLGGRERAQDRTAQADLRNAFTAEKVFVVDHEQWTDDPAELAAIEPSLSYEVGSVPARDEVVFVVVADDVLVLSRRSASGTCFYLAGRTTDSSVGYAEDPSCGAAEGQNFVNAWE